ncbi:hypothetical protein [Corynebacterium ulcerans]|uniref:hypothetical protein n=1 Tax=Corynebacterium ulcerans TaxID=65058 RepID=UPI000C773A0B|nr:hypothetical protein [Corynebacterium ulcerans]PLW03018.1 hypothetical protein BRL54_05330 [Corynebacterium ulcerans]
MNRRFISAIAGLSIAASVVAVPQAIAVDAPAPAMEAGSNDVKFAELEARVAQQEAEKAQAALRDTKEVNAKFAELDARVAQQEAEKAQAALREEVEEWVGQEETEKPEATEGASWGKWVGVAAAVGAALLALGGLVAHFLPNIKDFLSKLKLG